MLTSLMNRTRHVRELRDELEKARHELRRYSLALEREQQLRQRPPARLRIDGGMPQAQIEQVLAGTNGSPIVKAVEAYLGARLVSATDRASDKPSETIVQGDRTIVGYSETMRLHDAGIAFGLGELLLDLQGLTADKEDGDAKEEPKKA